MRATVLIVALEARCDRCVELGVLDFATVGRVVKSYVAEYSKERLTP